MTIYYAATTGSDSDPGTLGSPFRTVAKGISVLAGGDTLYLRAGTYDEAINNPTIASGSAGAYTLISAYQSEVVTIRPGSGAQILYVHRNVSYIEFCKLIFDGTGTVSGTPSVYLLHDGSGTPTHLRFRDCEMTLSGGQGILFETQSGAATKDTYHELLDCHTHHNGSTTLHHGFYCQSNHNTIDGVVSNDNPGLGGQVFKEGGVNGIDAGFNIVRNCKIYDNGQSGLAIDVGNQNECYNNLVYGNTNGIRSDTGVTNALIYNNTVYGNTSTGIIIGFTRPTGGPAGSGSSGVLVRNNISYGNGGTSILNAGTSSTVEYNLTDSAPAQTTDNGGATGTGTIASNVTGSNPQFVAIVDKDFHLRSTSPCIDAGYDTSATVAVDWEGNARPLGTAVDIGAYEFIPGTVTGTKIYYTATTGNNSDVGTIVAPFLTLAKGLSVLCPGDTLYLRSGTYAEASSGSIPGGTSWSLPVTVAAYPTEVVTLQPTSGTRVLTLQGVAQKYIAIKGLVFDAINLASTGVSVQSSGGATANHIRFDGCEIKNAFQSGLVLVCAGTGDSADYCEVLNCLIHDNGRNGTSNGLNIESSHNLIKDNRIYDNASTGIQIFRSSAITGVACTDNTVTGNRCYNNATAAAGSNIFVNTGDANLIANNICYGCGVANTQTGRGIRLDNGALNSLIYNNTCYGNRNHGILISTSGVTGTLVKNNIVYGNGTTYSNSGTSTVQTNNLNIPTGTTDPKFVDSASNNFRLLLTSPCIDSGADLSASLSKDADGNVRPLGVGWDQGAYEYGAFGFVGIFPFYLGMAAPITLLSRARIVNGVAISGRRRDRVVNAGGA